MYHAAILKRQSTTVDLLSVLKVKTISRDMRDANPRHRTGDALNAICPDPILQTHYTKPKKPQLRLVDSPNHSARKWSNTAP